MIFTRISFLDFHVDSAAVKVLKIAITRILSVAMAGIHIEQLANIDRYQFHRADYIEWQHLPCSCNIGEFKTI